MTLEEFTTNITTKLNDLGLENVEVNWSDPQLIVDAWTASAFRYGSHFANTDLSEATINQIVTDISSIYEEEE